MHKTSNSTPHGFTLIEFMLALSILLIIITSSGGSLYSTYQQLKLSQAGQELVLLLKRAKNQAVTTGSISQVSVHSGSQWCAVLLKGKTCNCITDKECAEKNATHIVNSARHLGIALSNPAPVRNIVFQPVTATSLGSATTLTLSYQQRQPRIVISNLGRIRHCSISPSVFTREC